MGHEYSPLPIEVFAAGGAAWHNLAIGPRQAQTPHPAVYLGGRDWNDSPPSTRERLYHERHSPVLGGDMEGGREQGMRQPKSALLKEQPQQ